MPNDTLNTPRPARGRRSLRVDQLAELAEQYRSVGVDPIADRLDQAVTTIEAINADLADTLEGTERERAALIDQLADGTAVPSALADQAAALQPVDQLPALAKAATARIREQAARWLHDQGDDLLRPLDQAVQEAAAQITQHHPLIEEVPHDPALHFAPPDVLAAWQQVHEASERIGACWSLAKELRDRLQLVPDFPPPAVPDRYWRWHRPELLDEHHADAYSHPHHWWAAVIAAGAKPAVLTAEQVAELHIVST